MTWPDKLKLVLLACLLSFGTVGGMVTFLYAAEVARLKVEMDQYRSETDAKLRESADAMLRMAKAQEDRLRRFEDWEKNGVLRRPGRPTGQDN